MNNKDTTIEKTPENEHDVSVEIVPKEAKNWTICFQYDRNGGPADPPHHIQERIMQAASVLHELGFALDIKWGLAVPEIMDQIDDSVEPKNR